MYKWNILFVIGIILKECLAGEPYLPKPGVLPFILYFPSRYRGTCVGSLVSRMVVMTAAVCVSSPDPTVVDTRPINVVVGSHYRHQRRGIRVQVTKVILPNLRKHQPKYRPYLLNSSPAIMLLKRKIPNVLTEFPLKAIRVAWDIEDDLNLLEECMFAGWHFFNKEDIIFKGNKFRLQRNLRAQITHIIKTNIYCDVLIKQFETNLLSLGFDGDVDTASAVCTRSPLKKTQPCHGMYGAPLICRGKIYGLLSAPDAQWRNCSGLSVYVHRVNCPTLRGFMECVSSLFVYTPKDDELNWATMKRHRKDYSDYNYDFGSDVYDKMFQKSIEVLQKF